ncbi:SixA phosphatase family protein [Tropicimonas isoalkanivorans]|uniref:Phosphohistidine phosphatase n=1 Tax=Tropicimonas isoalkanivorans TaxID=441112 RepID=A0A1I1PU77_9RHOB|nr:histidine phosphatase family protein [Tropicimonas isoalkanivorans]SFD10533.1 phosphohistidine phosphatase [Tropicimonas isoalkanivorans]
MKHLILLRHAKSSWVNPELNDIDRPLNKRGKRSAKALGKWLRNSEWQPDEILCSSARRARETWEALKLAGEADMRPVLYHATPETMLDALRGATGETVLMIGHNPGIAAFAQDMADAAPDHPRFTDYPTGALLVLAFDVATWSEVQPQQGKPRQFLTPHDLAEVDAAEGADPTQ